MVVSQIWEVIQARINLLNEIDQKILLLFWVQNMDFDEIDLILFPSTNSYKPNNKSKKRFNKIMEAIKAGLG